MNTLPFPQYHLGSMIFLKIIIKRPFYTQPKHELAEISKLVRGLNASRLEVAQDKKPFPFKLPVQAKSPEQLSSFIDNLVP